MTTSRKIPESVRRAIADPLVLGDGPAAIWRLPARADLPSVADVREALPMLREPLTPAPAKDARWCVRKMAKAFGIVLDDDGMQRWLTAHGKMPLDLWQKATLAAMQGDGMPTVEAFPAPVAAILARRRTDLERTEALLAAHMAPEPRAPFVPDPPAVRLRTLLARCRARHDLTRAARYERELAAIEERPVEGWAIGIGETAPAPSAEATPNPPLVLATSPTNQALMLGARARFWRSQGRPEFADDLERQAAAVAAGLPPVLAERDVPEAEHGVAA